jgi:hypothetical protein
MDRIRAESSDGGGTGRFGPVVVVALLLIGCTSTVSTGNRGPSTTPTGSASASASAPLPKPTDYEHACELEASVCTCGRGVNSDAICSQALPAALLRPLQLPTIAGGQACPTTSLNKTPVHPGMSGSLSAWPDGWYSAKTLWAIAPSYSGPVLVRGVQLDGNGPVGFGEAPLIGHLVIPPEPTVNMLPDGSRSAPGGTFVKGPGCYALQVDGLNFSYVLVFSVELTLTTADRH